MAEQITLEEESGTIENYLELQKIRYHEKFDYKIEVQDVDCAIASGAKYLVSNDKHFKILKKVAFPKVETLTANEFKIALEKI